MREYPVGRPQRIFTFDQVREMLAPWLPILADLPRRAFERWKRQVAAGFLGASPSTRASAVHDFMIHEAEKAFGGNVIRRRGRWLWLAAERLVVQFKKLGPSGKPRTYPTPAALEFDTQIEIPNLPPGMRVTLGYSLDRDATEVTEVRLVALHGDDVIFSEEIGDAPQAVLQLHPAAPLVQPPRRLRAKQDIAARVKKRKKPSEPAGE
jgi:hypothetical protein